MTRIYSSESQKRNWRKPKFFDDAKVCVGLNRDSFDEHREKMDLRIPENDRTCFAGINRLKEEINPKIDTLSLKRQKFNKFLPKNNLFFQDVDTCNLKTAPNQFYFETHSKKSSEISQNKSRSQNHTGWSLNLSLAVDKRSCISIFQFVILCFLFSLSTENIVQQGQQAPKMVIHSDELLSYSFHGNRSHVDFFRLLHRDGNSLLIGARNYVYNISMNDLSEHRTKRIEWISRQQDSDLCYNKGKSEDECHNYIRVLAKKSHGKYLVCGTNAYKPTCRNYETAGGKTTFNEYDGTGMCPYDPNHNSTFVFAEGHLYAGTVIDFQGLIPLVFKKPLQTDHSDWKQLNVPDFVHSFEYSDYVFFFFRETAVEYMNCGKRIYSRVARVCKSDQGGPRTKMPRWTSFLKSRLVCSFPGEFTFDFDEIQSVSDVIVGAHGDTQNEIIYAIFNTPPNSIPGSAVCSFSMRDVLKVFDGPFNEQKDLGSKWIAVPERSVPKPRPGACVNDSRSLPQENVKFTKSHPLMFNAVTPFLGKPLVMKASFDYRLTKLAVDAQVYVLGGGYVDVIFVATNVGVIFKVINNPDAEKIRGVDCIIIEEIHAFHPSSNINNLQIAKPTSGEPKLVVITDNEVKAISLERCEKAITCSACVSLQDPYCAWAPDLGICGVVSKLGRDAALLQNITSGFHSSCPRDEVDDRENEINPLPEKSKQRDYAKKSNIPNGQMYDGANNRFSKRIHAVVTPRSFTGPIVGAASMGGSLIYSSETLIIAVVTAAVAALVIGFISGFLFSRKCKSDDFPHFSETPYLDSKLNKCENSADPNMYTANNANLPHKQINNLVTNYNPKNVNQSNTVTENKLFKQAKSAYI